MVILRRICVVFALFLCPTNGWTQDNAILPKTTYYDDLKKELDDEIVEFSLAVVRDPRGALNYYNLGAAEFKRGDLESVGRSIGTGQRRRDFLQKAEDNLTKAIEFDPGSTAAYNQRGRLRSAAGRWDREGATSDFRQALQIDPKNAEAFDGLGQVELKREDALQDYAKAIELDPKSATAYFHRAQAKESSGQFEDAVKDYSRAIELRPQEIEYWSHRGHVETMIPIIEGAISGRTNGKTSQSTAEKFVKSVDDIIKDYTQVILLNPKFPGCYVDRARVEE